MNYFMTHQQKRSNIAVPPHSHNSLLQQTKSANKQYYCIFENNSYEEALCFSFGFNGYLENIHNIKQLWYQDKIHFAEFNENNETEIIQQSYALINYYSIFVVLPIILFCYIHNVLIVNFR